MTCDDQLRDADGPPALDEPDDSNQRPQSPSVRSHLIAGVFRVSIGTTRSSVTSTLHFDSWDDFLLNHESGDELADREAFGRYEGAIDALESFVLAAVIAGIDVQRQEFRTALETALAAIGNTL